MQSLYLAIVLVGGLILLLSLIAGLIQTRGYIPAEAIIAVAFGILIGPEGLDLFPDVLSFNSIVILEPFALMTVAFAVTSIALRLPAAYFKDQIVSMFALIGPGIVAMWLLSSVVIYWLLAVPIWIALLIGAAVTPTDPVLANTIIVGQTATNNIPESLRYLLSGEAGANDGLAHPIVFLPILVLAHPLDMVFWEWFTSIFLWDVLIGAIGFGSIIGWSVGRMERWLSHHGLMEETSVFTVVVALTFAVVGFSELLGANGILAVFAAGLTYNWQADPQDEAQEQRIEEVFNRLFTIPVFVFFGMILPWHEWAEIGWSGVFLVVALLTFRRLPMILFLRPLIPLLDRPAATLFVGWFGPIGIAALFYASVAVRETGIESVWTVVSLIVAGSILAHGGTSTLFTLWYGQLEDTGEQDCHDTAN